MGLTYAEADRVAKAVPNELNISLERAVETSPQLRELIAGDERVDKLIGIAKQLEGVARHASTHAAGIVISREPLTEIMPLQRATDGRTTMTQFEMHACEALGLLKFDFLGLINLTILADAVGAGPRSTGAWRSTSTTCRSTTRRPSSCCPPARRWASSSSRARGCAATSRT